MDVTVKINCCGRDSVLKYGRSEIDDDGVGDDEVSGV